METPMHQRIEVHQKPPTTSQILIRPRYTNPKSKSPSRKPKMSLNRTAIGIENYGLRKEQASALWDQAFLLSCKSIFGISDIFIHSRNAV
jgi:hypothetical protein